MAMNFSEAPGHAAALAIAAAADQGSTPPVASQQPGAADLANTHNAIGQLPMAVDQHRRQHRSGPSQRHGGMHPRHHSSRPSTSSPTIQGWGYPVSN